MTFPPKTTASIRSVQSLDRTEHSTKPKEHYSIIEKRYPKTKRFELFARNPEKKRGWSYWGNEAWGIKLR
jgi:N6-adenosine-specific RNA methylase IME4